jgi:integrase
LAVIPYVNPKQKKQKVIPGLYIDSVTGMFYMVRWIDGKTRMRSLKTKDPNKAVVALSVMEHNIRFGKKPEAHDQTLISGFYDQMIEEKKARETKASTLTRIDSIWRYSLEPFWGSLQARDINPQLVVDFMAWHRRMRPGVQFVNVFKYLGNLFTLMNKRGVLPTEKIPELILPNDEIKHHAKKKGRVLLNDEYEKILKHCLPEVKLQIGLGYLRGMRKNEIATLERDQIKKVGSIYMIELDTDDTKTGKARKIPVPKALSSLLTQQLKSHNSKWVFPMIRNQERHIYDQTIDKWWVIAKRLAGIKGRLRFHDLKHSAATNMARNKVNPMVACEILGMSIVQYQRTYLNLQASELILAVADLDDLR